MHYLTTLLIIAVVCFAIGYFGTAISRRAKPWMLVVLGMAMAFGVMWLSDAYAIPADVETATAYNLGNDPTYRQIDEHARPCSRLTFGEALRGEIRPLPVACVLPLPLEEATVMQPAPVHPKKPMFVGLP